MNDVITKRIVELWAIYVVTDIVEIQYDVCMCTYVTVPIATQLFVYLTCAVLYTETYILFRHGKLCCKTPTKP